jgi:hypothetical protein
LGTYSPQAEASTQWLKYYTNFDVPDAHFEKLCLFSDAQAENVENPKKI